MNTSAKSLRDMLAVHADELLPAEDLLRRCADRPPQPALVVPPPSSYGPYDHALAGTAFSWWLRSYLVREHGAFDDMDLLQIVLDTPSIVAHEFNRINLDEHYAVSTKTKQRLPLRVMLRDTMREHRELLDSGADLFSDDFIDNCITLTQYEAMQRLDEPVSNPSPDLVDDVRRLAKLAVECDHNSSLFTGQRYIINPWLPSIEGLAFLGADLIVDGTLVSLNSSARQPLEPLEMVTAMAYMLLEQTEKARIGQNWRFEKLGFYASRFGQYVLLDPWDKKDAEAAAIAINRVVYGHRRPVGEYCYDGCLDMEEAEEQIPHIAG